MKCIISALLAITFFCSSYAQLNVNVTINSGTSGSICTDEIFGMPLEPELQWQVNIDNRGPVTYPQAGICFKDPPYLQFSETFSCSSSNFSELQICFTAFEDDGAGCVISPTCLEEICQNFLVPAPGSSVDYDLTIPNDGNNTSWGTVNFTIEANGSTLGNGNNLICDAIDLGILESGSTIGNAFVSSYSNICANNFNEPSPWGGNNDQGVWFEFTTGDFPGTIIELIANSDPQNFGNAINLQLAVYESSTGDCNGNLTLIEEDFSDIFFDEEMSLGCLQPNTKYFILVDGEINLFSNDGVEGFFGLQLVDNGLIHPYPQAPDFICDALHLGTVSDEGMVSTLPLSQSNFCASNIGEPNPGTWANQRGVWYSFVAPNSGHVIVTANSDEPAPNGVDPIDLELAVYASSNGACSGALYEVASIYNGDSFDETMEVKCLFPGATYWIMVDGSFIDLQGIFDVSVADAITPTIPNTGTETLVACDSLTWMDGFTYYESNNSATHALTNITGCDSVVTLNLTILYSGRRTDSYTECTSLTWIDGNTYTDSNNSATFTIAGGASNGCDSIVSLDLKVLNPGGLINDIVYVDKSISGGLNNGSSWSNAFKDLQPALDLATTCSNINEVRVASGTYFPTESPDESSSTLTDRKNAFHLDTDVMVKGSYNPLSNTQNHNAPSILSGDFNGDDVIIFDGTNLSITNITENAYHVLVSANLSNSALVDGFTIEGGHADSDEMITYSNMDFTSNSGAGIVSFNSSPTITNTAFMGNTASMSGGGMYNNVGSPILINSVFSCNQSSSGAGMFNISASPNITNATFQGNRASLGAGIFNVVNSSPLISNSVFYNNGIDIANVSGSTIAGANNFSENYLQAGFITLTSDPFINNMDPDGVDNILGTQDDGLLPAEESPLREVGNESINAFIHDVAGQQRIRENNIDVGAYEGRCKPILILGLEDVPLGSIYFAEQLIVVNEEIPLNAGTHLELNAPTVQILSAMDVGNGEVLKIREGGCR